jgi:hypothetical protein
MKVRPATPTWKYEYINLYIFFSGDFEIEKDKVETLELYKEKTVEL